jgi:DNA-binding transcriptional LysR family regulator
VQADLLQGPEAVAAVIARLPFADTGSEELSTIQLYDEAPVVIVAKDHVFAVVDQISIAELLEEVLLLDPLERPEWREALAGRRLIDAEHRPGDLESALDLVATGTGVLVAPQAIARAHRRRDVVHRPLDGVPSTRVALVWVTERKSDELEQFIGVIRGRSAASTRNPGMENTPPKAKPPRPSKAEARAAKVRKAPKKRHRQGR